jgi:hypothetical protein
MALKSFKEIEPELIGLNRRDQYGLLLQTKEWKNFRQNLLIRYGLNCEKCGLQEGPIEVEVSQDEWERLHEAYKQELKTFKQTKPKTGEEFLAQLEANEYIGAPILPSRFKTMGEVILQIHHTLYYWNRLPWQYNKSELNILCGQCHEEVHRLQEVYTYKDETRQQRKITPVCPKCYGEGYIDAYKHRDNGICYDCGGAGVLFDGSIAWEETK